MEVIKVGERGTLFLNEKGEISYLINGDDHIIICDTSSLGKKHMQVIEEFLVEHQLSHKKKLIFNSHADYDHIWGNDYYSNCEIISSKATYNKMIEKAVFEYQSKKQVHQNAFELRYPTITFSERLKIEKEGIEFIYAPGHTVDSTICYDQKGRVLYVGDLVEAPLPYLLHYNLHAYLKTLHFIKSFDVDYIVNGHNGIIEETLIDDNIKYISDVLMNNTIDYLPKELMPIHDQNLKYILLDKYDDLIKNVLQERFDYQYNRNQFWSFVITSLQLDAETKFNLSLVEYHTLYRLLNQYFKEL